MTEGDYRVGVDFNPSGNERVDYIKHSVADLIDYLQDEVDRGGEAARCAAIARTELESAAMWAVKAITKRARPS